MTKWNPEHCLMPLLLAALLLAGCASPDKDIRSERKRNMDQRTVVTQFRVDQFSLRDNQQALAYYQKVDDLYGQWQSHTNLANWYSVQRQLSEAREHAESAYNLAGRLADSQLIYSSSLQLGQLRGDKALFNEALQHASTPLQQAMALSLTGRHQQAYQQLTRTEPAQHPAESAFVLYHYGKETRSFAAVMQALDLYRQADNPTGVIDSLFLGATLAEDRKLQADLANRALLAAETLQDELRSNSIRAFLKNLEAP